MKKKFLVLIVFLLTKFIIINFLGNAIANKILLPEEMTTIIPILSSEVPTALVIKLALAASFALGFIIAFRKLRLNRAPEGYIWSLAVLMPVLLTATLTQSLLQSENWIVILLAAEVVGFLLTIISLFVSRLILSYANRPKATALIFNLRA